MKCTNKNVDKVFDTFKSLMVDDNGRGEFDYESDLLGAIERTIDMIEEEEERIKKEEKNNKL